MCVCVADSQVWFIYRRHRVAFVIDTSPSMRTLRGSRDRPPLSVAAEALRSCFLGLVRPMGLVQRHEVLVSVVAHVQTRARSKSDAVLELVQGYLLTGHDEASAAESASRLASTVSDALARLETSLWQTASASASSTPSSSSLQGQGRSRGPRGGQGGQARQAGVAKSVKTARAAQGQAGQAGQGGQGGEGEAKDEPGTLEPLIQAGIFALKWLPADALPALFVVTDGVCQDKQLLTTYDGLIMQLCRHDIALHVMELGSHRGDSATFSALGMM